LRVWCTYECFTVNNTSVNRESAHFLKKVREIAETDCDRPIKSVKRLFSKEKGQEVDGKTRSAPKNRFD
jgi:hypothetical protein